MRGDLGPSMSMLDFTVAELFAQGLPISLQVGGAALLLALGLGGLLGVAAALHQNRNAENRSGAAVLQSQDLCQRVVETSVPNHNRLAFLERLSHYPLADRQQCARLAANVERAQDPLH